MSNTTTNTNSAAFKAIISAYILNAVHSEDKTFETDKDRMQYVADCFDSEYNHEYNRKQYPNTQDRFAQWLMGLPSSFNIDYENYRIIELAKEWGTLPLNANDKQEDRILSNWWNFISFKTFQLMRKYSIEIK